MTRKRRNLYGWRVIWRDDDRIVHVKTTLNTRHAARLASDIGGEAVPTAIDEMGAELLITMPPGVADAMIRELQEARNALI